MTLHPREYFTIRISKELLTMTNNNNHFRVTAYHPTEDITVLVDSYGYYEQLWQLSSMLVIKGFNIIEVSDASKFLDVVIPPVEPNRDKLYLRACMVGTDTTVQNARVRASPRQRRRRRRYAIHKRRIR